MKSKMTFTKLLMMSLLLLMVFSEFAYSQRSKIEGIVKDAETGEPLFGANVIILNTNLGAATDIDGKYFILNVPIGTHQLQASMIGYTKKVILDVLVSLDRVTKVDFELSSEIIQQEEIVVFAERNELHKEVSGTQLVITDNQLRSVAGIREISSLLELQPGVVNENGFLTIRGGAADQTGTFINGFSYNNAAVGNAETNIPLSAVDQVSVLSGGFNAEYGNFRSGLINITTKSGSKDKYHGTVTVTGNIPHPKRFGPSLTDPRGPLLRPYLDPSVAFVGTEIAWADDEYLRGQYDRFNGWISLAETFNSQNPMIPATPYDYYLLGAWMHMAEPDYAGLEALSDEMKEQIGYYQITDEQKRLFKDHMRDEEGMDYNIDIGFGGPLPLIGKYLGDATFYISHTTKEKFYVVPVTKSSEDSYVTLGTIKSNPLQNLTLNLNLLWKRQLGVSPIKPAFGDFPDTRRGDDPNDDGAGGFMPEDNLKAFTRLKDLDNGTNYMFDPMIFPLLDQTSIITGLTLNHVISPVTFWELSLSYATIKDHSPTGDNRDNTVLTVFGPFPVSEMPYGKLQYAPNNRLTTIIGLDTITYQYPGNDAFPTVARRFRSKEGDLYTNVHSQQYRAKADLVTQIGDHHYVKSGLEYNLYDIDHKMWHKWNNNAYNTYEYNYHRFPSQTAFYAQDQISYEGIVANLGVRLDYFYGGGGNWPTGDPFSVDAFVNSPFRDIGAGTAADSFYQILSSGRSIIWELWEEYDKTHPGFLEPVKNFLTISPRLGISFPVTTNSKFYFNYGHFRSQPPYYSMYLIRYRYTKNGLYDMANPNLEPPRTVSYELGFAYNFFENIILTMSGYYKDVSGENGELQFQNSSSTIEYDSWANNNYQDIQGIEINITKNDNSWINGWINFNYMLKKSGYTGKLTETELDLNTELGEYYDGEENRFLPQPRLTSNITFISPGDWFSGSWLNYILSNWQVSVFAEWKTGKYFTFPEDIPYLNNNLQFPDYYMVDLRLSKTFNISGFFTTFYIDISNVFNFKNLLNQKYAFANDADEEAYLASLRLPAYNSPEFDNLRAANPGLYLAGNDKVGDSRSSDKPYINDPNYSYFLYGRPRDVWFGVKIDF
jgi:outer membrane receptor protein involved in Fe transport